jgi:predicted ArsR family transcriptional regulator
MTAQRELFDTRAAAADSIAPRVARLLQLVLETIRASDGMTADEVAARLKLSPFTVRPRVAELHLAGGVVDSGRRRKNRSGRNAVVWVAKEQRDGSA